MSSSSPLVWIASVALGGSRGSNAVHHALFTRQDDTKALADVTQAWRCTCAGAPFHDFRKVSAQPVPPGEPVRVRFELMPTAYTFAKVRLQACCRGPQPP